MARNGDQTFVIPFIVCKHSIGNLSKAVDYVCAEKRVNVGRSKLAAAVAVLGPVSEVAHPHIAIWRREKLRLARI